MNRFVKKSEVQASSEKLNELVTVNKEFATVENEEKELKEYLHTNIFNFLEGKDGLEDIFAIQNSALNLEDHLDRNGLIMDRTIPLLEFRHITKFYQGQKVPTLVNVSFKVYPGDFHVLVGASGSGKSSLISCLYNKTDYSGEILVNNKFVKDSEEWKNIVSVVPANIDFDPEKTAYDLIFQAAVEKGASEIEALSLTKTALDQLKLTDLRNKKAIHFSLLETKKVALARALVNDPHVVILDEPLTGLQQHEKVEYLVLLAKLQKENRGILVLSHLIDEFSGYANLITILSKGFVFYSGLIENLELHNLYKFTVTTSDNQSTLSLLKKLNCKYRYNDVANNIFVKFDNQLTLLLFQKECANKNIAIYDLRHAALSLEDLYGVLIKVGTAEAVQEINNYRLKSRLLAKK